jgi:hypothetical protein
MKPKHRLRNAATLRFGRLPTAYATLALLLLLAACADSPMLSGEWHSRSGSVLTISQEGHKYFVKAGGNDFMGRFKDDGVAINSPIGDIKYSRERDKLYWAGDEYSRKEVLEAEARKTQAELESFVGLWKKIPHEGGESVAPLISIDLPSGRNLAITEVQSFYSSSAFRNPQYGNGVITGMFLFTIDNDHRETFEIRKTSQDALSVTIGSGLAEAFRRHVETDAFTGNWVGYYPNDKDPTFSFAITKVLDRYKIEKRHFDTSSTLFATVQNGKLVAEGDPGDFYKFQPPAIESRSDGALWYVDGADDVKMTRVK